MVGVSLSLVPASSSAEDVSAPFVLKNDGYISYVPNIDQSCEDATGSKTISPPYFIAQTFTSSRSGHLSVVSVQISYMAVMSMSVRCEIRSTTGGFPTGTAGIITYEADTFTLTPTPSWCDITFSTPASVVNGQTYAIVIYTVGIIWNYGGTHLGGSGFESYDNSESWSPISGDFGFRTFVDVPSAANVKKVAWHPSGNFALGVTGADSAVWEYYRELGSWSVAVADFGHVLNDIVYEPTWDRFYAVGDNGMQPVAWEVNPYNQPMTLTSFGSPAGTSGTFHGVCAASEGVGPYAFLAVGSDGSSALACWYNMGTGWVNANGGDITTSDGHVLYDVDWDQAVGGSYYAVGADGAYGMIYRLPSAGSTTPFRIIADRDAYYAIDWAPAGGAAGYALIAGAPGAYGNLQSFSGSQPTKLLGTDDILSDVSWHPDGTYAIVVGQTGGGSGAIYRYGHASGLVSALGFLLPAGTGPLNGVALKGPSSPSSGIIVGSSGALGYYPSVANQDTTITVNTVFPKLYWIGFNNTAMASRLDQQVPVDADYYFTLQSNYSLGWAGCEVFVQAWHDAGVTYAGGSSYPGAPSASTRNLAFTLYWSVGSPNAVVGYPTLPDLEITTGAVSDTPWWSHPTDSAQDHHRVSIPIHIGAQVRNADYGGIAPAGPAYSADPLQALNNPWSWDFNIVVRDMANPSSLNRSFGEFGIQKNVGVSVIGNPSCSAPPGTVDNAMSMNSVVTYSANMPYWVNVSIPHLYQNGLIGAPNRIGAGNVSIENLNPLAGPVNSYLSAPVHFPKAENTAMNVWGRNATFVQPAGNGTVSAGPWLTDYNAVSLGYDAYTELQWWVTIGASVPEGVYIAVITFSVDS